MEAKLELLEKTKTGGSHHTKGYLAGIKVHAVTFILKILHDVDHWNA